MENVELVKSAPEVELPLPMADNLVVVARNSSEMAQAQEKLILWADAKIEAEKVLLAEAEAKLAKVKEMKQRTATYANRVMLARNQVTFYEKIRFALQSGYCIVPNFPVEILAIRTTRVEPDPKTRNMFEQKPMMLPTGEGRYVDPTPKISSRTETIEGKPPKKVHYPDHFREVTFPAALARVEILEDLNRAQKLKVFDSIGILPSTRRKPDPMLIGQICNKRGPYNIKTVSFMIAWWIDTSTL
jgi:hypothetical protein